MPVVPPPDGGVVGAAGVWVGVGVGAGVVDVSVSSVVVSSSLLSEGVVGTRTSAGVLTGSSSSPPPPATTAITTIRKIAAASAATSRRRRYTESSCLIASPARVALRIEAACGLVVQGREGSSQGRSSLHPGGILSSDGRLGLGPEPEPLSRL